MNSTRVVYLSKKGMKELKKTISRLEHDQQKVIRELRELDKVDNHDERLARIEKLAQLDSIETALADSKILMRDAKVFPRKRDALVVALGSAVDMIDTSGRMIRYTLVDSIEANPSDGRISVKSPLGQHLLGKTLNDTVQWGAGMKAKQLQLVRIA
jgi:transcription elongation factor GreA